MKMKVTILMTFLANAGLEELVGTDRAGLSF